MRSAVLIPTLMGLVSAQGVTQPISPPGSAPAGCKNSWDGKFQVTVVQAPKKRDLGIQARAECGGSDTLVSTLAGGILKDAQGRTGYIASNYQFQFDGPPQAGAIYTAGFSVCGNGSIALGGTTTFYQCRSGDFSNLYDRSWAAQCTPISMVAVPCGTGGSAGQVPDGQVTVGTKTVQTTIVRPISDGQPQVITTAVPVPIKQIPDGQVQVPTSPVKQIPDGQVQVPTSPVKQIPDGQVQVPTSPVKQIPDGQVQVTSAPKPPATTVKQISDGQVQVTSPPPTTISTRTPTANTTRPAPSSPVTVNDAGRSIMAPLMALAIGVVGALALL